MMKVEERKPAPLPPEPWTMQLDPWCSRTLVVDAEGCVLAEVVGTDEEAVILADLFCRAPALEAELKQAFEDHQEVCVVVINLRALLRELAATVRTYQRSIRRFGTYLSSDGEVALQPGVENELDDVLRRAEAETAMENANG